MRPLDILFWVIVVAIIYMLVRPGSKAGTAVIAVAEVLAGVIATATGAADVAREGKTNGG